MSKNSSRKAMRSAEPKQAKPHRHTKPNNGVAGTGRQQTRAKSSRHRRQTSNPNRKRGK